MKYKIGDKVIVKSWKALEKMARYKYEYEYKYECELDFGFNVFTEDMKKHCNKIVTIETIDYKCNDYTIIEDEGRKYKYYDSWLYPVTKTGKILYGDNND